MTRLNYQKAARRADAVQTTRISAAQKKYIASLLRQRGMKWDSSLNTLSTSEASEMIQVLKVYP